MRIITVTCITLRCTPSIKKRGWNSQRRACTKTINCMKSCLGSSRNFSHRIWIKTHTKCFKNHTRSGLLTVNSSYLQLSFKKLRLNWWITRNNNGTYLTWRCFSSPQNMSSRWSPWLLIGKYRTAQIGSIIISESSVLSYSLWAS